MSNDLGVDFFINFTDLDPVTQKQCIFFTKKGRRCSCFCRDNQQAIALHRRITRSEDVLIDDIIEYILCNCCREARAQHRDRIVNIGLLIPLAERWLDEILTQRRSEETQGQHTEPPTPATSTPTLWASSPASSTYANSVTSTPRRDTTIETPITSLSYYQAGNQSSRLSKPNPSPTPDPRNSLMISNSKEVGLQPVGSEARYDLRSRKVSFSTTPVSRLTALYSQASLSDFQPHIQEPAPEDAVSWKICSPLYKRDVETGSVYVFNRASSPGHVKIGWTAVSVKTRLEDWSKCGYIPNKLFSADRVPNAQRVETLTHHELIKEWRRERRCKAEHCQKSHQEWFEVSQEKAIQVLGDWANFFKKANPYERNGSLKIEWKKVVQLLIANGEIVTSTKLLEHYEASIRKKLAVKEDPVGVKSTIKIEEQVRVPGESKNKDPVDYEEIPDRLSTIRAELEVLDKPKLQLKSETLPSRTPMDGVSLPMAERQSKADARLKTRPLVKIELDSKASSKGLVISSAGVPSKIELSLSNGPLPVQEPLAKAPSLFKMPLVPEERTLPKSESSDENLLPEQISLPPSSILEATNGDRDSSGPGVTDTLNALVNIHLDRKATSSDPPTTPITECRVEDQAVKLSNEHEVKPHSEHVKQIVQTHERELESQEDDEITIVEHEAESGIVEWLEEETLVDIQAPVCLEMPASKIIDKLANVASTEGATKAENGLIGIKVMEREVSPDVESVALS